MKKGTVGAGIVMVAAAALVPLALVQATSAGATVRPQQERSGAINIESWLYAVPSGSMPSTTVWDCFKITGAVTDQGGGPTWTDSSYDAPLTMASGSAVPDAGQFAAVAASEECLDKVPAGAFVFVPPPAGQHQLADGASVPGSPGGLTSVIATHTLVGQKGDIFISFAGTYNMTESVVPVSVVNGATVNVRPLMGGPGCTWVITGGTGAYEGLQGSGTCSANATLFPWVNHTEQGRAWWGGPSGGAGTN